MALSIMHLLARQVNDTNGRDGNDVQDFWWTKTGFIVRYAVIGGLFVLFVLFLLAAYLHGRRPIKKGLAPLEYHRWLVQPRRRGFGYSYPYGGGGGGGYGYNTGGYWQAPPPMYNAAGWSGNYEPPPPAPGAPAGPDGKPAGAGGQAWQGYELQQPKATHHTDSITQ